MVVAALLLATSWVPVVAPRPVAAADPPTPRFLGPKATDPTRVQGAGITALGNPRPGFTDTIVISGLTAPTAVRFSPDGRVFVAEKGGRIRVYPSLTSTTPTDFIGLRTNVNDFWDRGLLGLTLDPAFPANPYVYALYTRDAAIGATAPRWNDACPSPPGPTTDGCVVSGRLSRFTVSGSGAFGSEQVLIDDWCQQYPSHSIGDLRFGADGALYVSAGDGASFTFQDYGQGGGTSGGITPRNPCGDPPGLVGGQMTAPTARGGRLRTQSLRRPAAEPVVLNGTLLRVDPATGAGLPTNPLAAHADPNARRIVAYGMRNPFRFTVRPGTNEIWIGDVGDVNWEEIDRIVNPLAPTVANFGWPCYEGAGQHGQYRAQNLEMCNSLYATPTGLVAPYYSYAHRAPIVAGESCPNGSSVMAGITFYNGPNYPAAYRNALFFTDHARNCIWAMKAGTNGLPDPTQIETFVTAAANPVALEVGPGGDIFYVDHEGGAIHRIRYDAANEVPTAVIVATPPSGLAPLTVAFDGTRSSDPEGGGLTYAWDLDGDGAFDDSTAAQPGFTYATEGTYTVGLRVTDAQTVSGTGFATVIVHGSLPEPVIDAPLTSVDWAVGDRIDFSGHATDDTGAELPDSALSWSLVQNHCPSSCHTHTVQTWPDVASGFFNAPDHDYPSYIELLLTATGSDNRSATATVRLDPRTVDLTFVSSPPGLGLAVGIDPPVAAPFTKTVIVNSLVGLAAPSPQVLGGTTYTFGNWSDGGLASHNVVAPAAAATYTATFSASATPTTSYLSDLAYVVIANGYGPAEKDRSNGELPGGDGKPLTLASVVYAKGIGTHAASDIRYPLAGCTTFTVKVGLDDEVGANGSLSFQIWGDATKLADSGVMTGASPTQTLTVDLTGRSQLRLVVDPNGVTYYDHGDWADARLTCGSAPPVDTTAPTITALGPLDGATAVATGTSPTISFSEPIDPATISGTTLSLVVSGTTTPLAAIVTYDSPSRTATLDPSATLANATTYVATVRGGPTGVTDLAGLPLAADRSWSFTTAAAPPVDTIPPTITGLTPADGATAVAVGTSPTVTFSEPIAPASLSGTTFSLVAQGTTTPLAATVTYDSPSRTATLDPTAVLANSTTYVATVRGGATGVTDLAGLALAADRSWSFTTAAAPPGGTTSYLSDLAYVVIANGYGPAEKDRSNGEAAAGDGRPLTLASVVYPKGIGVHAASDIRYPLAACTTFTVKVGLDDEVGANGSLSFQIWGDAVKLADSGIMTGASPTQTLTVDLTGRTQLRLVVDPNGVGWHDHGDWADARLTCGSGPPPPVDTTPPTITGLTPADGATAVAVGTSPTVTFSEPIAPASLSGTTFSLVAQGTTTPLAATVTYDPISRTATLDPTAVLANSTTYVTTVRGGTAADIRLVTLGDSITSTRLVDVHPCGSGWPAFLTLPLADFHNAGIAGNTTTQMLGRLATDVLAHAPTDVTILGGTNDLSAGFATATTLANLGSIIDQVRATGATAWLQTIPPRSTTPATIQAVITLNAALRTLASDRGARLIDTWAVLAGADGGWASVGYTCDGVHPTDAGAAVIAGGVQVALGTGVTDLAGLALAADRSWSFTTAAAPPGGTTSYLSDLAYVVIANGYGPAEKDRSNGEAAAGDGRPLTLASVVYPKGIGVHAASDIRYPLAACTTFTVKVGLDDEVGANGSLSFQIWGDAVKLADSGIMTGASPTQTLTVDLTGRTQLRLVVDPNGVPYYDHGDWADARLTCGS